MGTFSSDWIHRLEHQHHWNLYWHQLHLILNDASAPTTHTITEIGVGTGLVSEYLKRKGHSVTTIDIDENKNPDIVADVTDYTFEPTDILMAFEVFEHIPFESMVRIIKQHSQNGTEYIAFSIPHAFKTYFFANYWLPGIGHKTIHIGRKRRKILQQHHHWELDIGNIDLEHIKTTFADSGYIIQTDRRYKNHHFFLAKRNS